ESLLPRRPNSIGNRSCRQGRRLVEIFTHLRLHPGLAQLRKPQRMDARVLVGVFDLGAAFLDAHVSAAAFRADAALPDDGIALGAEPDGDIARGPLAGVEVLVEHAVRWREAHAVPPIDALKVAVALVPKECIAGAVDKEDVQAGPVPMALLVGADRH